VGREEDGQVEELPPRPFLAVLDRIGLPTWVREGERDERLDFGSRQGAAPQAGKVMETSGA